MDVTEHGPLPAYTPVASVNQAKPMIRVMSQMLKTKLPRLFRARKGIESNQKVKVSHRKKKEQPQTKYW